MRIHTVHQQTQHYKQSEYQNYSKVTTGSWVSRNLVKEPWNTAPSWVSRNLVKEPWNTAPSWVSTGSWVPRNVGIDSSCVTAVWSFIHGWKSCRWITYDLSDVQPFWHPSFVLCVACRWCRICCKNPIWQRKKILTSPKRWVHISIFDTYSLLVQFAGLSDWMRRPDS